MKSNLTNIAVFLVFFDFSVKRACVYSVDILTCKDLEMAEWDYEVFWKETIKQLQNDVGELWFSNIEYLRGGGNSIFIKVPSVFYRDQVKNRYQKTIENKLTELSGAKISLNFEIGSINNTEKTSNTENSARETKNNEQNTGSTKKAAAVKQAKDKHSQLDENYTFEKYIIGENNSFAANAAIAISKNPGKSYNPFFIYGGVGQGKTHLMHAIGNSVYENSDNKVICVTSEEFLNEYVEGTRLGKMSGFKNKYRYTDVLLIDDIQILKEKPGVQEELFHTFNALISSKKQIVFTCDRPPSELKNFSERLINRFEMGLKVDLQPPQYEVRLAIIKSFAEDRKVNIPDEVYDLIAKNVSSNVRDLIGAIRNLIAFTELMGKSITLEIARERLRDDLVSTKQSNMSIENIQKVIAEYFHLSTNDLKGKKKTKNIVFPRQLAIFITREITDFSTTEIGESFGGRDHTTILHSTEKIKGQLLTDPSLDSLIENLKRQVKEYSTT